MRKPAPLDIVWCRFPTRENPDHPGPKLRPVLVLGDQQGGKLVVVAYGTSQAHQAPRSYEITLRLAADLTTVFDLSRLAPVPFTPDYFPAKPRLAVWPLSRLTELVGARAAAQAMRR